MIHKNISFQKIVGGTCSLIEIFRDNDCLQGGLTSYFSYFFYRGKQSLERDVMLGVMDLVAKWIYQVFFHVIHLCLSDDTYFKKKSQFSDMLRKKK